MRRKLGPKKRWAALVSRQVEIAIAEKIEKIVALVHAESQTRYRLFTRAIPSGRGHFRGQARYTDMEEALLELGEEHEALRSTQLEFHLGYSARFVALNSTKMRLTVAKLSKWSDNPFSRAFRRGNILEAKRGKFKGGQMRLIQEPPRPTGRLIAVLCYAVDPANPGVPLFIEIRFADENWNCCEEYVDLLAILRDSRRVHTEAVEEDRETPLRTEPSEVRAEDVEEERSTSQREIEEQERRKREGGPEGSA